MIEQLVALAKIADIDAEALRADTELRDIPQRMGSLQSDVKKLGELLAAEKQELLDADKLLAAQEDEINNSSQALAKSKAKGARVRNTREADAVERELDTIRRLMKERETERDSLRDAIGKRRASVEKHAREFAELEKFAAEEQAKADTRLAELTAVRERILTGRSELVPKVPADVLRRYEMIRAKRQGMGMAAIKDSTCSGCFVALTPQQVIAIKRGDEFAQCPRCLRILYAPEVIAKYTDGAPTPPSTAS
ncbi:MAG TPA: C4-type zinc ribbon domain-containing protein [Polyangiales bacterium]|nr:C4-type zinc ribbon domain-containing protein [Polyangiales bacterium]